MNDVHAKPPEALPFRPERVKVTFSAVFEASTPEHYARLKTFWEETQARMSLIEAPEGEPRKVEARYEHVKG